MEIALARESCDLNLPPLRAGEHLSWTPMRRMGTPADIGNLLTRVRYAESLTRLKKYEEAIQETARNLAWDPVSPICHVSRSMIFFRARRYDESIEASYQALDLDPSNVNALWWQGVSYAGKREFPKSIAALNKALSMAGGPLFRGYLGFVYGWSGEKDKALAILRQLTVLSNQRFVSPVEFALVYAGLGDADSTFEWLERAYQAREADSSWDHCTTTDSIRTPATRISSAALVYLCRTWENECKSARSSLNVEFRYPPALGRITPHARTCQVLVVLFHAFGLLESVQKCSPLHGATLLSGIRNTAIQSS